MIYAGEDTGSIPVTTGSSTQIQTSTFNYTWGDNTYVGYMYGTINSNSYNATHSNKNNSTIKENLDSWYEKNLKTNYAQYLSTEAGFCGDRESYIYENGNPVVGGGTGTITTYYGAYIRLRMNQQPTFECINDNDLYTISESGKGNQALTYPIGLITADEVSFAGGLYNSSNSKYYLYTGQYFWTMSPYWHLGGAYVWYIDSDGDLNSDHVVGNTHGIRPVINLKADVRIEGAGTVDQPYEVVES